MEYLEAKNAYPTSSSWVINTRKGSQIAAEDFQLTQEGIKRKNTTDF